MIYFVFAKQIFIPGMYFGGTPHQNLATAVSFNWCAHAHSFPTQPEIADPLLIEMFLHAVQPYVRYGRHNEREFFNGHITCIQSKTSFF